MRVPSPKPETNPWRIDAPIYQGVIGWVLRQLEYPLAAVVLGMILGPIVDENLRRSFMVSEGRVLGVPGAARSPASAARDRAVGPVPEQFHADQDRRFVAGRKAHDPAGEVTAGLGLVAHGDATCVGVSQKCVEWRIWAPSGVPIGEPRKATRACLVPGARSRVRCIMPCSRIRQGSCGSRVRMVFASAASVMAHRLQSTASGGSVRTRDCALGRGRGPRNQSSGTDTPLRARSPNGRMASGGAPAQRTAKDGLIAPNPLV